jgi:exoribonuclease R
LYNNGKVVSPLLPIQEECSLLPNEKRLGISMKFKWTGTEIKDISFQKVNIVNNNSLTYEEAQSFKYSNLLKEISSYLAGNRLIDSHDWIEQFMIFYNCEVAKILVEKKEGILRFQDPADIEKLNNYKNIGINELFLANKSAKYICASNPKSHWGLHKEYYCHATSPIRRFADIVNQMILCDYFVPGINYEELNELHQHSKKYERDSFFLTQILGTDCRHVQGISLSDHRVWVPVWNKIITCKNTSEPGTPGTLKYSLDMDQSTWKRKMVFRFEDTNCQE